MAWVCPCEIRIYASTYYTANTPSGNDSTAYTPNSTSETQNTYAKSDVYINRTDSKLAKIIATPYPPFDIEMEDGKMLKPSGFYLTTDSLLYCDDPSIALESTIGSMSFSEMRVTIGVTTPTEAITDEELRDDTLESKLLHSEFYSKSLVYDSYVKQIALEKIKVIDPTEGQYVVPIRFKMTNTMNSRFAFKFDFSSLTSAIRYEITENYEEFLVVERNNEQCIYNNNYLNYMRNGYNYDKKQNAIAMINNIAGGISGVASNVARGAMSGNYIGAVLGAGGALLSTITSAISQQLTFEQKQQDLKSQAANVIGSNDVEILNGIHITWHHTQYML